MISGSLCGMFQREGEHKGKHKLWPQALEGLYEFYLFVLLSLYLATLDHVSPAAPPRHPCSSRAQSEVLPGLVLGSTSCFWPDRRASRRESGGAGSGTALPSSSPYTCNHILERLQPHKRIAKQLEQAAASQGTVL